LSTGSHCTWVSKKSPRHSDSCLLHTCLWLISSATKATQSICPFEQSPFELEPDEVSNICWNLTVTTPFDSSNWTISGVALSGHSTSGSSYSSSTSHAVVEDEVEPALAVSSTCELSNSDSVVGASVGLAVGTSVGDAVGPVVGANVGLFVGPEVGPNVGLRVGPDVG